MRAPIRFTAPVHDWFKPGFDAESSDLALQRAERDAIVFCEKVQFDQLHSPEVNQTWEQEIALNKFVEHAIINGNLRAPDLITEFIGPSGPNGIVQTCLSSGVFTTALEELEEPLTAQELQNDAWRRKFRAHFENATKIVFVDRFALGNMRTRNGDFKFVSPAFKILRSLIKVKGVSIEVHTTHRVKLPITDRKTVSEKLRAMETFELERAKELSKIETQMSELRDKLRSSIEDDAKLKFFVYDEKTPDENFEFTHDRWVEVVFQGENRMVADYFGLGAGFDTFRTQHGKLAPVLVGAAQVTHATRKLMYASFGEKAERELIFAKSFDILG